MATLVRPVVIDNCQDPVSAYPHDRQLQEFVSRGIQKNRKLVFKIELPGQRCYDLLRLLDEVGIETLCPLTMRECVRLGDTIMEQLRAQGFYGEGISPCGT